MSVIIMIINADSASEFESIVKSLAKTFSPSQATQEGEKILQSVAAPEVKKTAVKKSETAKESAPADAVAKPVTEVTQEQIRAAVLSKKDTHREAIKQIFSEFGCEKIPALKPEQYRDFLTKIEAL